MSGLPPIQQRAFIAGMAIIVLANAVALAGVAYNRSGAAEATLALTERELTVPFDWGRDRDNSGLSLTLDWRANGQDPRAAGAIAVPYAIVDGPYMSMSRTPAWLDSAKLAELGFDMTQPAFTYGGRTHYQKLIPKQVFLVLELNGPAYELALTRMREWAAREDSLGRANQTAQEFVRRAQFANTEMMQYERGGSRLFIVDAGLHRAALREKYADRTRYAIVRGAVKPQVVGPGATGVRLEGQVMELAVEQINVPRQFRMVFDSVRRTRGPRGEVNASPFSVTVAFGQRLEPWITSAARLP